MLAILCKYASDWPVRQVDLKPTPFTLLFAATLLGLAAIWGVLAISLSQPYLGLTLSPQPELGFVWIADVDPDGPAAQVQPGAPLDSVGPISLRPFDLVEESDTAPSYVELEDFLERQEQLYALISAPSVTLTIAEPHAAQVEISPAPSRPIRDLPLVFWVQIVVGLISVIVGVWVWCLRQTLLAPQLLALAGIGIALSAFPAAIYSARELALPSALFRTLSAINHFGTLVFGVAMVSLFLTYPRRLVPAFVLWVITAIFAVVWVMEVFRILSPGPAQAIHLPVVILMLGILAGALAQFWTSRNDPVARAALRWFALAVILGAGTFVLLIIVPNLIGFAPTLSQGFAFLLFVPLFIGVAAGVARDRLFELEGWAFSILFYFVGVLLLLVLDAILIAFVAFERAPAFGLSLLLIALTYLPSRDWLARLITRKRNVNREDLFRRIVDVALTTDRLDQEQGWHQILRDVYQPLNLAQTEQPGPTVPEIHQEGVALSLPGAGRLAPVQLRNAHGGRRLFSLRDKRFADEICAMLAHAISSRDAQEVGASAERTRIARDMHDNLGAQLLSALHSDQLDRKDTLIRQTISDLRDIINNNAQGGKTLGDLLADMQLEARERLALADIGLDWVEEGDANRDLPLAPNLIHSLRSILRETVSNTIRHSGAQKASIKFQLYESSLSLAHRDDGTHITDDPADPGHGSGGSGLANIETRVGALGGSVSWENSTTGFVIRADIPLVDMGAS